MPLTYKGMPYFNMHNNRRQISPEIEINTTSRSSTPSQLASDQLHSHALSSITGLVWKNIAEQSKPRRRSLDYMLGDGVAHDQQNTKEIVRETLRQVIMKHKDWDSYLTTNSDYLAFISNWSCHWWCWYGCCPNHRERHFLQALDGNFLCALHYAVLYNNLRVCESLLRDKKCAVNVKGIHHETVLHMYARRQNWSKPDEVDPGESILCLLFEFNSTNEIDAPDDEFRTPLHHAVKRNDYSYAKWLVDHGADVTKSSRFNETPLHLACSLSLDGDCVRMIEMLLSAADPILKRTMFFRNPATISQLQRCYANMQDANGKTALCRAAEKNHTEAVKFLLSHVDNNQWETALVSAIKSGNCTILKIILDACNRYLTLDIPILHLACKLNNGRQIVQQPLMMTETPLSMDEDYITAYLVERLHLNIVSDYNKEGYTPILVATYFGFVDYVKYLLSNSTNIEQQLQECTKYHQHNILHVCAEQERQNSTRNSSVQFLYDLDKNTVEMALSTAKAVSSTDSGHLTICKFILEDSKFEHVANRLLYQEDNKGNTPLHLACKQGNIRICELFIKHMKENRYLYVKNLKQRTPLHVCAKFGNCNLVKLLLPMTIDKKIAIKALDYTQDIDGKTPLHFACINGNMEVIKYFIEEFNASLLTQAENLDTPFLSACEYGHLNVVNYLLDATNVDSTIRNSKGHNALDVAIVNHRENIVRRLLSCKNWRRLMENAYYDDGNVISTPMRELIIFMPAIAYELIDTKLTMIKGNDSMTKHQVIYDYTFFEDQYRIRDWMYGDDSRKKRSKTNWFAQLSCSKNDAGVNRSDNDTYTVNAYTLVRNHPLHIIAKCEQINLMEHDYCIRLGTEKFRRFGLIIFSIFFFIYALFVLLYTITMLQSKHPFYYYNLFNQSLNGTLQWDYGYDLSICQQVGAYLTESNDINSLKSELYQWSAPLLYLLFIIFATKNVCVIVFAFPRIFRKMSLYFESLAIVLCFLNVFDWDIWQIPLDLRCPIQWQLGCIGLLFSWITILIYMRYVTWMNWGLYVVMMQVIFSKFLKCIPVLLTLICGFGFTYYMLLQYQTPYATPLEAILRTAISLYDLGYEARLYAPNDGGIMLYPVIYFVFILTEIALTIIITNLLIGLAVGEIPTLKTQAQVNRNIIFYEMLFDYEFLHMQLKLFIRCLLRRIRHGEFPCCYCRCHCSEHCSTLTKYVCCECAVRTQDHISKSRHRHDKFFLARWLEKIDGWLVEKEIQSAITYQKEWKKKNTPIRLDHND